MRRACGCACGEIAAPGRRFRVGHDRRLVAQVATSLTTGDRTYARFVLGLTADDAGDEIERAHAAMAAKFGPALAAQMLGQVTPWLIQHRGSTGRGDPS